jgi:HEAT repeats/RMKL-like, methyltransferase domain
VHKRRAALDEAVRSRGFTPSVRDVDGLVDLIGSADESTARDAERALRRLGSAALPQVLARTKAAPAPLLARLCRTIGRLAPGDEGAAKVLCAALDDADPKTRRNAIIALGQFRGLKAVEAALLQAWEREDRVDHRRSLAAALGKMGSGDALDRLRAAADELTRTSGADSELVRITEHAVAMLDRTAKRGAGGAIDAERAPPRPVPVILRCRAGIEALLASEAGMDLEPRVLRPGRVLAVLRGKMKGLFECRTMLDFAFPLPQEWIRDGEDVADAVARSITSVEARMIFDTWTVGPARYRLAWGTGGHQRALVWRVAKLVGLRAPYLVNDPTNSTWEVTATPTRRFVDVEVAPKAVHDPRFFYRVGDVPAASHPTLAAALVRVAGVSPDDVVWDPFVGGGTELVERALAGPFARLVGTDVDPRALEVARGNF